MKEKQEKQAQSDNKEREECESDCAIISKESSEHATIRNAIDVETINLEKSKVPSTKKTEKRKSIKENTLPAKKKKSIKI